LSDELSPANLSVHCTGTSQATARWSVAPPGGERESRIVMAGRVSTAKLTIPELPARSDCWVFQCDDPSGSFHETSEPWDEPKHFIEWLQRALEGDDVRPNWPDACLGLEIVDSVRRSLRRKRAIDVTVGERSEEQTFKGYMSAMGCLLLVTLMAGVLVLAVIEGFRLPLRDTALPSESGELQPPAWPIWARLWPVYPLVIFLLLQLLLRLTRPAKPRGSEIRPAPG
jgi:hypothetical protein